MKNARPWLIFAAMFTVFLLLNLNFTILRSIRSTLTVVDLGGGAHLIPAFELLGAMPGAMLMTWGLSKLLQRFTIERVFVCTLAIFLCFFLLFSLMLYPALSSLKGAAGFAGYMPTLFAGMYYTMSELWKPALAVILFWGLINQCVPLDQGKKLYAPLLSGGSLGALLSGPIISTCTSEGLWGVASSTHQHWTYAFNAMTGIVLVLGLATAALYTWLYRELSRQGEGLAQQTKKEEANHLTKGSLLACWNHPNLRVLSWIVIIDYVAYPIFEVIFLGVLKLKYPSSSDYCNYMGFLALWSGIATFGSSLVFAPYILQRFRWVVPALITPICMLITECLFFFFLCNKGTSMNWLHWTEAEWLALVVALGAFQYCICRGAKYSFFDASKELAFVHMPSQMKMPGKLFIDGICARGGRGASSILSLSLIGFYGGVVASAFASAIIAVGLTWSWISATWKLGQLIDPRDKSETKTEDQLLT